MQPPIARAAVVSTLLRVIAFHPAAQRSSLARTPRLDSSASSLRGLLTLRVVRILP